MLPRAVPLPKPKLERKEDHVLVLRTIDPVRLQQLAIPDACHAPMRSLRVNPGSCALVFPTSPAIMHRLTIAPTLTLLRDMRSDCNDEMSILLQPESPKSMWSTARHHVTLEGCFGVLYMETIDDDRIFETWTL